MCCAVIGIAAAQQSQDFDGLARRASEALDTNPEQAAALYGRALTLRPNWADGWLYRGAALFQLGRFSEARDSLRRGVELAPEKGTGVAFLGMAEYELGDYSQALADMLKGERIGLADKPDFIAAVHYRAALCYLRSSNFPQAFEQLKPLAINGVPPQLVIEVLGITVLGLPYLPQTLPPDKQELVGLAGRAAATFIGKGAEPAAPLFEQLGAKFPQQRGVHYIIGVSLINRDPGEAEKEFRKELQLSPSHVLARVHLALLLTKDGDVKGAVPLAAEAAKLDPSDAMCQATLGRVLLSAGKTADAIAALERAEKIAPDAARTHFYLVEAYRRAGRTADALKEKSEWDRLQAAQQSLERSALTQ